MLPFFTIWTGQAVSLLGSRLIQFALVWWLTKTTGSATVLATATMMALLPGVFIGPFAGALVDRWNRRVVMVVADGGIALVTLGLAVLFGLGVARPWHLYVVMFLRAIGGGFHWPAMRASTSLMVPKEHLSRIQGLNQVLQGGMSILAPPLGALLLGLLPMYGIAALDVGTALLAILPLLFISIPQPARSPQPVTPRSLWGDVLAGLRYIWGWPGLMIILVMAAALNFLFNPAFSLMPILVLGDMGKGPAELGWLESALGIGFLVGGLILGVWGGFRRRILTSLMGLVGLGAGVLVFGMTPPNLFWLALGAMFFVGVMNSLANGPLIAVVQDRVAPEVQGRVLTALQSVAMAMSPLGLAVAGPVADWLGVRVWYVAGGLLCMALGGIAFFIPAVVHIED